MVGTTSLSLLSLPSSPEEGGSRIQKICSSHPGDHGVGRPMFRGGMTSAEMSWRHGEPSQVSFKKSELWIYLHLQGKMKVKWEGVDHHLKMGDLVYVPPKTEFELVRESNEWCQSISFCIKDVKDWEVLRNCCAFIHMNYSEAPVVYCLLRQILGALNEPEGFARSLALGNAWMLNRVLMRLYILAPKSQDPHFKSFFTLTDNIVKEPSRDWTVEHMAKSLHLSQSSLLRVFKKHFELSPKEFIIQARMNFASELLINSDESLKRISNNVGYVNVHTFSRIFSNYFGLPPGKYRNSRKKGLDNKS
jgi:AraC-like DNA-binding protein/mannose-6-phosphate isomerase-like protein (cupin superfamily)